MGEMNYSEIREAAERRLVELQPLYEEYLSLRRMLHTPKGDPGKGDVMNEVLGALRKLGAGSPAAVHRQLVADGSRLSTVQVSNTLIYAFRKEFVARPSRGVYEAMEGDGD